MNLKKHIIPFMLAIVIGTGCIFNDEDDSIKTHERSGYTIRVEPIRFDSYETAARLIIVSIDPDSNFSSEVKIRIDLPEMITSVPGSFVLDCESRVGEFELYLDPSIPLGSKEVKLIATYDDMHVTTSIAINVVTVPGELILNTGIAEYPYPYDFVMWMAGHHPEYGIEADSTWFCFYENPMGPMSFYPWYFNVEWEVKHYTSDYGNLQWFALRKRGDVEPCLFVRGVRTGYEPSYGAIYEWEEITAHEYGSSGYE